MLKAEAFKNILDLATAALTAAGVEDTVAIQRGRSSDFYDINGRQDGERFYAIVLEHRWDRPLPETVETANPFLEGLYQHLKAGADRIGGGVAIGFKPNDFDMAYQNRRYAVNIVISPVVPKPPRPPHYKGPVNDPPLTPHHIASTFIAPALGAIGVANVEVEPLDQYEDPNDLSEYGIPDVLGDVGDDHFITGEGIKFFVCGLEWEEILTERKNHPSKPPTEHDPVIERLHAYLAASDSPVGKCEITAKDALGIRINDQYFSISIFEDDPDDG